MDRGSNYPRMDGPGVHFRGGSIYPTTPSLFHGTDTNFTLICGTDASGDSKPSNECVLALRINTSAGGLAVRSLRQDRPKEPHLDNYMCAGVGVSFVNGSELARNLTLPSETSEQLVADNLGTRVSSLSSDGKVRVRALCKGSLRTRLNSRHSDISEDKEKQSKNV